MSSIPRYKININVHARYLEDQSRPENDHYVFAYTIRITNCGDVGAQLISRHWLITNADGQVQEVRGEGVVGEQPILQPGEGFEYTSGAVLTTNVGSMQGSYQMRAEDGTEFDAPIAPFSLSIPRTLH